MLIPKKENVFKTNDEDPIFMYYLPVIGWFYEKRLKNTLDLMRDNYKKILDIGYGSGILFPELSRRGCEIFGVEIHGKEDWVRETLRKEKIRNIKIEPGDIYSLPYKDDSFDCVVSVSTLEHLENLNMAMKEIKRVLKPKGEAILSFPAKNMAMNSFFRVAGYNPSHIHPSGHDDIIRAAKEEFDFSDQRRFLNIYYSIKCVKKA